MKKIGEIKPYKNNPRFNDDAVQYVANSIKEFGFKVPIVIDKKGVIVAGHTRLKAAEQLGMKEVPCIIADDLNEEQIKAFRLADNKTGEMSYWDDFLLGQELEDITIDMSLFGFGEDVDFADEIIDDKYTKTVKIPQYEITGDCPEIVDLYDELKTNELIEDIEKSSVSDDEKRFLIEAAKRHTVFNYRNIAEYYAHATPEMQRLMEKSALVIIDVDDAIANGYVQLSEAISGLMEDDDE